MGRASGFINFDDRCFVGINARGRTTSKAKLKSLGMSRLKSRRSGVVKTFHDNNLYQSFRFPGMESWWRLIYKASLTHQKNLIAVESACSCAPPRAPQGDLPHHMQGGRGGNCLRAPLVVNSAANGRRPELRSCHPSLFYDPAQADEAHCLTR